MGNRYLVSGSLRSFAARRGSGIGPETMVFSPYHESWRQHPILNNNLRKMFPGFGYAVAIFSTYLAAEFTYYKLFPPKHDHHTDHHSDHHSDDTFPKHEGAFEPKEPPKDRIALMRTYAVPQ